ncbi:putative NADH-dependent butanol dehydrogenase A [Candidatus Zixiibacteriota bacterium]|nr:putative NADH-dependent butanol dehydrogenase A [candidate division Zixibacteria bacterium]
MQNFTFFLPTKIIFGPGEIQKVGIEAKTLGEKALIVTGKRSASAFGIVNKVEDLLEKEGIGAVIYDKIEPNPRSATIDNAAKLAEKNGCDFVIGLGGGSAMDAAKGIAAAASGATPIWDYIYHGQPIVKRITKALPIMEIPTLAATGSEANSGAVISNWETNEKAVLGSPLLFPRVSIIDPELTITVPKDYTIDGGIDIICHVIEGFFTGADNTPIQDRFSLSVARTVMDYLPEAVEDPADIEARSQLSWSSAVALSGMVGSGRGGAFPLHAMEHALSAHYDISHGRGLALLLPRLMEHTYPARPHKYAIMARELFGIDPEGKSELEVAKLAVDWMIDFLQSVGRYIRLSDLGISDESKFGVMADDTLRIYSRNREYLDNPKPLYKKDIIEIFRMAL